jgi:tryptophan synthase beta subunit
VAGLTAVTPHLPDGAIVIINVSGRGDKDMGTIAKHLAAEGTP